MNPSTCKLLRGWAKTSGHAARMELAPYENIVSDGIFDNSKDEETKYTCVPLCIIESGSVVILENGKAVKTIGAGNYFGVFETAQFLKLGSSKQVGRWTLRAQTRTVITVVHEQYWRHAPQNLKDLIIKEAIDDPVPKSLSRLERLDELANTYPLEPVNDTVLLFYGHMLNTNYDLLRHLTAHAGYTNTFIVEKPYSTTMDTVAKLARSGAHIVKIPRTVDMPYDFDSRRTLEYAWQKIVSHAKKQSIRKILVVCDGGDPLSIIPFNQQLSKEFEIVAVEQTQSGIRKVSNDNLSYVRVMSVATNRLKKSIESGFISRSVIKQIQNRDLLGRDLKFGVIGNGAIGKSINDELKKAQEVASVYDNDDISKQHLFIP